MSFLFKILSSISILFLCPTPIQSFLRKHPLYYRQNTYLDFISTSLFPPFNTPRPRTRLQQANNQNWFTQPLNQPPSPNNRNRKIQKWIELLRPSALPPTLLLCLTGGWLMNPSFENLFHSTQFIVATLCTLMITSTSMVINDMYDMNLDKIDHPTRPLPSGIITITEAGTIVFLLIGAIEILSMNYLRADLHWIIHLSTAIIITYTPILKRIPFVKNLACASMVTLSLFFTGLSVSTTVITSQPHFPLLCIAMSTVFFGSLYNEILLDMRDIEGDRIHRINTIPVLMGLPSSYVLVFFLVYLNLEWNFLSMYSIFGIVKAMGYLLFYSPLLLQIYSVYENLYSKESLSRASKATSFPLLLVMLYLCVLTRF